MSNVLIIAEHLDGTLNGSTAKCVAAAQALDPEAIDIAVLAADPAAVAAEAAKIEGVRKVLTVANDANAHPIAQVVGPHRVPESQLRRPQCVLHSMALFRRIGGFDPSLRRMVDCDLVLRHARNSRPGYAPFIGCHYLNDTTDPRCTSGTQPHASLRLTLTQHLPSTSVAV